MNKILGVTTAVAVMTLMSAGLSWAKGHDQGFGAGVAGPATAGKVDDGQSNRDGMGPYGKVDASIEAKAGERDKSEVARDKSATTHPSSK